MRRRRSHDSAVSIEKVTVSIDRDAVDELGREAEPYLLDCSKIIGESIVEAVPRDDGVMVRTYDPRAEVVEPGEVHLSVGSPFWHWLEYGTANNPPYRPVQRGVETTGARYEAS
jgi:hypothetical protein